VRSVFALAGSGQTLGPSHEDRVLGSQSHEQRSRPFHAGQRRVLRSVLFSQLVLLFHDVSFAHFPLLWLSSIRQSTCAQIFGTAVVVCPFMVVLPEKCCRTTIASPGFCLLGTGRRAPVLAFSFGDI